MAVAARRQFSGRMPRFARMDSGMLMLHCHPCSVISPEAATPVQSVAGFSGTRGALNAQAHHAPFGEMFTST